jgi:diacylglycerol O-acyltransferase / wax synthase
MRNHLGGERLSWGDTVFLNLERSGMPLNVACVSLFDGDIVFDDYVRFVESRLPLIPRYLMRVVPPPLNAGLPTWEYDPEFDIRTHVREVVLKHGSIAELKAHAGKMLSKVMDRQRPLWDLTLVRNLKGNRTGLIARMHHCLADGIAGVEIMSALMDASPTPAPIPKGKTRFRVPRPRDPMTAVMDGLASSCADFTERILSAWGDVLSMTQRTLANGSGSSSEEFAQLLPEITAPTQRLCFNVLYRGPQKFACTEIPLADVRAIRHACDASINDVLLALVTATIRRYAELHGDQIKGRLLRIMVPVNLRGNGSAGELGNRISLVPVTIPLDIRNPRKLLAAIHRRTEFLKRSHAAELVGLAGGMIGILPGVMQSFAGPMISQLPITPFNMVCTNVPGPQYPLYLLGHKMTHWYPYVPIGGELAMNCAILSYDGMIYFGFSGDAHATPDLARLEKFLRSSFEELRDAAGLNRAHKRAPRRTPRTKKQPVAVSGVVSTDAPRANGTAHRSIPLPLPRVQTADESPATKHPVAKEKPVVLQETA